MGTPLSFSFLCGIIMILWVSCPPRFLSFPLRAICLLSRSVVSDSLRPHGRSPPGSSVHGDSPGKNTGVGCRFLLQGIFPTQGSNPGLPHCRWILYPLSHQGIIFQIRIKSTKSNQIPLLKGNFNLFKFQCRKEIHLFQNYSKSVNKGKNSFPGNESAES